MSVLESLQKSGVGLLIVFIGLVFLIVIVSLMGAICKRLIRETLKQNAQPQTPAQTVAPSAAPVQTAIADRDALVAVLSAAVAEELGVGVDAIRVVSLKQIN